MRDLRHPRRWLALWLVMVAAVIALSLIPPPSLPTAPPDSDKLGHFLAYFALMAMAVQLFAARGRLLLIASALALLGVALEFAQGALTTTRMFDLRDALANGLGAIAGLVLAWTPAATWLQRYDGKG